LVAFVANYVKVVD